MTFSKKQVLEALDAGGADAVRQLVDPPRPVVSITEDLTNKASDEAVATHYLIVARALNLWYINPTACDLDRKVIDLRGEVSRHRHDGWLRICRIAGQGYWVEGCYIDKAYKL